MNIAICPTLSDNITYVAAVSSNRCFMYSLTRINHLRYEISQTGDMHLLQEFIDDNTLSVNVKRLRGKLEELGLIDRIETRRGQGYILK